MQNPQYPARRPWDRPQPEIRLTHADRDAVAEVLREAYSQGQLDEDEFEERLDLAMKAKVGAELEPLTRDLGVEPQGGPGFRSAGAGAAQGAAGGTSASTPVERVTAAVGHAGNYFFPVVLPLLLLVVSDRVSPYIRRQAMESLNFQLLCLVGALVSALLFFLVVPLFVLVVIGVAWAFLPAVAAIAALMGKDWRYPMPYRFLKD